MAKARMKVVAALRSALERHQPSEELLDIIRVNAEREGARIDPARWAQASPEQRRELLKRSLDLIELQTAFEH